MKKYILGIFIVLLTLFVFLCVSTHAAVPLRSFSTENLIGANQYTFGFFELTENNRLYIQIDRKFIGSDIILGRWYYYVPYLEFLNAMKLAYEQLEDNPGGPRSEAIYDWDGIVQILILRKNPQQLYVVIYNAQYEKVFHVLEAYKIPNFIKLLIKASEME